MNKITEITEIIKINGFKLDGKCVFCEFHKLEGQHYFSCSNPDASINIRRTAPLGGEYPMKFSPACLDGACSNWQRKIY